MAGGELVTVLERLEAHREEVLRQITRVSNQVERMGFLSKAADEALDDLHRELTELDRAIKEFHLEFAKDAEE